VVQFWVLILPNLGRTQDAIDSIGVFSHVEAWASRNNLRLNQTKSKELIFIREKCGQSSQPPPLCPNTERVSCAKVLGITLNDRLSVTDHVNNLLTSCSSLLYVMRVLRGHGISTESLHDMFCATILAKITYCLPAWSGLCSASDRAKLDSFLNRCKRLDFCANTLPTISHIFSNADDSLFKTILKNSYHVLYPYLPENQYQNYHLRQRPHNKAVIPKTTYLSDRDYIMRMLYKNRY